MKYKCKFCNKTVNVIRKDNALICPECKKLLNAINRNEMQWLS